MITLTATCASATSAKIKASSAAATKLVSDAAAAAPATEAFKKAYWAAATACRAGDRKAARRGGILRPELPPSCSIGALVERC